MTIYDLVFEKIQEKYENGEYTIEEAEVLNDLAYDRYVNEGAFKKYRDMQYAEKDKIRCEISDLIKKKETIGHGSQAVNKKLDDKIAQARDEYDKHTNDKNYERMVNRRHLGRSILDDDVYCQNIFDKKFRTSELDDINKYKKTFVKIKKFLKRTHKDLIKRLLTQITLLIDMVS